MAVEEIDIQGKPLQIRRAVIKPEWKSEKVLTSDIWTYIDLWIRRNARNTAASFYWAQARQFYRASLDLPITASPLTLYYCFLNAAKALLAAKNINISEAHGLTGKSHSTRASIRNEEITLKGAGVLPSLIAYYGDPLTTESYNLKDILYNLAFVHRAYCLSYQEPYLFFSLDNCRYVRGVGMSEAWVTATLEPRYDDRRILGTLTPGYERDVGFSELVIRKHQRFRWKNGAAYRENNIQRLTRYHSKLRRDMTYISGVQKWYLKRRLASATIIDRHAPTLILAAMHRLSELSRYDPFRLSRLLDTHRNWLLAEFVKTSPIQFLDEIACEMTGEEIFIPGIHTGSLLAMTS